MSVELTEIFIGAEEQRCPVCLGDFSPGQQAYAHTRGGERHPVHKTCLIEAIAAREIAGLNPECSVCRRSIDCTTMAGVSRAGRGTGILSRILPFTAAVVLVAGTGLATAVEAIMGRFLAPGP